MLGDADGSLYFMEMNTRLQVEHTITEEVTGIDLVEHQLRIAANEALDVEYKPAGHSIQCRINAEDVQNNFRPQPGKITRLNWPEIEGLRVDTHLVEGDAVSPHYDSMIAKVIATAPTRMEAISKLQDALKQTVIEGVPTTIPVHQQILQHPQFQTGHYDTNFLETMLKA
jgi:acetyl-CoA carboxylase biotin carboxylase subunit